jgi:hypothetical protein
MTDKIKILFLGANPADIHQLQLGKEAREIEAKIQAASQREHFELKTQWAVRPADLMEALLRFQPHIVHFSGHGSPTEEIILEDNDGKSRPVSKQALIGLFKVLKDNVRIIVLNSCYSRPQAEALSEVIDYTVGASKAIKDKSAVAFAAAFYLALAYGRSVQDAFELAKLQIDMDGLAGSDIPMLMVRDGVDSTNPFLIEGIPESDTPELLMREEMNSSEPLLKASHSSQDESVPDINIDNSRIKQFNVVKGDKNKFKA